MLKDAYIIQEISPIPDKKDIWKATINEGDVILDKGFRFSLVQARFGLVKPITEEKVTNRPYKHSDRLLRIKELNENSAVIATLHQNVYYNGDIRVIEEYERLRTVPYGEIFSVGAKMKIYDAPTQPKFSLVIYKKDEPIEPYYPTTETLLSRLFTGDGSTIRRCSNCGHTIHNGEKPAKFCTECGNKL